MLIFLSLLGTVGAIGATLAIGVGVCWIFREIGLHIVGIMDNYTNSVERDAKMEQ